MKGGKRGLNLCIRVGRFARVVVVSYHTNIVGWKPCVRIRCSIMSGDGKAAGDSCDDSGILLFIMSQRETNERFSRSVGILCNRHPGLLGGRHGQAV